MAKPMDVLRQLPDAGDVASLGEECAECMPAFMKRGGA